MRASARAAATAGPAGAEAFDLRQITPQAWKNGCGLTREIAIGPRGAAAGQFDWRISVAEVTRAAPFSLFPGVDRCIVLLAGGGLHLRSDAPGGPVDHRLDTPFEPFHFSGDEALAATPLSGPSSDLNVMTRRGLLRSDVRSLDAAASLHLEGAALLFCCAGHWRTDVAAAPTLAPQQGLLWRGGPAAVRVEPDDLSARLLFVRLCQHRAA